MIDKLNDTKGSCLLIGGFLILSVGLYNVMAPRTTIKLVDGSVVKLGEVYQQQVTHYVKVESSYFNVNVNGNETALTEYFSKELHNLKGCDYNACNLHDIKITMSTRVKYRSQNFPLFPYTLSSPITVDDSGKGLAATPAQLDGVLEGYLAEMQDYFEDNMDAI